MNPLEEIVAHDCVLRDATGQASGEGCDVVDPFADVDPGSEHVLIHVRNGAAVDVDGGVAAVDPREGRAAAACRGRLEPRLNDGAAGNDSAGVGLELRLVEGMGKGTDEPRGCPSRQHRIGVQGDHEADAPQLLGIAFLDDKLGAIVTRDQIVELLELAALTLPAHPATLALGVTALAVQEVKRPFTVGPVCAVQVLDARNSLFPEFSVLGALGNVRLREVREENETQARIGIAQVVAFDLVEELLHLSRIAEQARHHDRGLAVGRNPLFECQLGKDPGGKHWRIAA